MALPAEEPVVVVGVANAAVAKEPVIATKTEQLVVAHTTVQTIPPLGAEQRISACSPVNDANKIIAARREVRHIEGEGAIEELNMVTAAQARDAELLHQRPILRVAPFGQNRAGRYRRCTGHAAGQWGSG